jgi:hypothetical protein
MLAQNFLGELGFFFSHSQSRRDAEQEDELGTANRKTKVGRVAPPTAQASSAEAPFLIAPINLTQMHGLLMCECVGPLSHGQIFSIRIFCLWQRVKFGFRVPKQVMLFIGKR